MAILVLQHSDTCHLGLLGDSLRTFGQRTRTVRLDQNQPLPADLDDVHGVVSLGGPQSVNDPAAWVAQEKALLSEAHAAGVPVLGLCLGAQMLATALGGEVTRLAKPNLGWHQARAAAVDKEDALYAGVPWRHTVFCWNNEHVSKLPEGAQVVMKGENCPVLAYRVGPTSYGIQYHPEWSRQTILDEIAGASAAELAAVGTTAEALRQATAEHTTNAERLAMRTFELCNLLLFPASRQQPGLRARSPLHH